MAQVYVIGRVTADIELKNSINDHPYVRFDVAENIGSRDNIRTQYFQVCAMGEDAMRITHAHVKRGSLIWISGSMELEIFTKKDGITTDKRVKIILDNWGFVPASSVGRNKAVNDTADIGTSQMSSGSFAAVIDGEREDLSE